MFELNGAITAVTVPLPGPSPLDKFNFIIVLVSIILSFGLSKLVEGVGEIVQDWNNVRLYPLHVFAVLMVFLLQLQFWWGIFADREIKEWNFFFFLLFLLTPLLYYLISELLVLPKEYSTEGTKEYSVYYWARNRVVYGLAIAAEVNKSAADLMMPHAVTHWMPHLIRAAAIFCLLVMVFLQEKSVHYFMYVILVSLFIFFVIRYTFII